MNNTKATNESNLLTAFFAITLLWTWICGLMAYLFRNNPSLISVFFIVGGPAPSIVGFCMVISTYTNAAKKDYFKRMFTIRRDKIKFLLVPVLCFGATIVLGFIWGIWHFFWSFIPGQAQYEIFHYSKIDWVLFLTVFEIAVSFVIHLVYIKTGRSILAGALSHMLCNLLASQLIAPMSAQYRSLFIYVTILIGFAAAIYAIISKKFNGEVNDQIAEIKADIIQFNKERGK